MAPAIEKGNNGHEETLDTQPVNDVNKQITTESIKNGTRLFISDMLADTLEKLNRRYGKDPHVIELLHNKIEAHKLH